MASNRTVIEELEVSGAKLVATIKDLVRQGNVRRVSIKSAKGTTLLEIPMLIGIAGAVLLPIWAAVGALAALVAQCRLVVERVEPAEAPAKPAKPKKAAGKSRGAKKG